MMTSPRRMMKAAKSPACLARHHRPRAFTLVEILLALAIAIVLMSLTVVSVRAMRAGRTLPDVADRFASSLRMARADAATLGRRIRLVISAPDPDAEAPLGTFEIELDPLGQPGTFTPHTARWTDVLDRDNVEVLACRQTGQSTWAVMQAASGEDDADLQPVMFYPDGSCDSAEIHLRLVDDADDRIAVITLDGMNARATTQLMTGNAYDDYESQDTQTP